ncbi:MAG: hypothetical protein ACYC4S_02750 [Rhodoferax sp.]
MKLLLSKLRSAGALALCSSAWLLAHAGTLDASTGVTDSVSPVSAEISSLPAAPAPEPVEAQVVAGWGAPVALGQLDEFRGGADLVKNDMQLSATVANNSATHVISGNNAIADGAFANMSGLPMVIQNSGSNVLIQNATIINVQFQ